MAWCTPGFPVHHQLPEVAQTHIHWVSDAIQPSYPLSSSSLAFNRCYYQGLSQWVSPLHLVVKILELQHQSFHWIFRTDFLKDWLVWSPCSLRDSPESLLNTTVQKHQFLGISAFFMAQFSHYLCSFIEIKEITD